MIRFGAEILSLVRCFMIKAKFRAWSDVVRIQHLFWLMDNGAIRLKNITHQGFSPGLTEILTVVFRNSDAGRWGIKVGC
jgi:hypothetical protein